VDAFHGSLVVEKVGLFAHALLMTDPGVDAEVVPDLVGLALAVRDVVRTARTAFDLEPSGAERGPLCLGDRLVAVGADASWRS
jgi:hypothetical protein